MRLRSCGGLNVAPVLLSAAAICMTQCSCTPIPLFSASIPADFTSAFSTLTLLVTGLAGLVTVGMASALLMLTLRRRWDQSARLRALAAHLQSAREEERTKVAREIHDELGQALTVIKLRVALLVRPLPEEQRIEGEALMRIVDDTMRFVRRIATELRPSILDDLGLVEALWSAGEEFHSSTGIRCHFDLPASEPPIDRNGATALFRIVQETLTNVARHAHATDVHLTFVEEKGTLRVEVHDNGIGMETARPLNGGSLGILGMQERARLLGGQLTIRSAPGQGTTVIAWIPTPVDLAARETSDR
jgi:signal transduction histidine kinase